MVFLQAAASTVAPQGRCRVHCHRRHLPLAWAAPALRVALRLSDRNVAHALCCCQQVTEARLRRLYDLIWRRTLASQMAAARIQQVMQSIPDMHLHMLPFSDECSQIHGYTAHHRSVTTLRGLPQA